MTKKQFEMYFHAVADEDLSRFYSEVRTDCSNCPNRKSCKHRNCYRRLPMDDGGLSLCTRLDSSLYSIYEFEIVTVNNCSSKSVFVYVAGKDLIDAILAFRNDSSIAYKSIHNGNIYAVKQICV